MCNTTITKFPEFRICTIRLLQSFRSSVYVQCGYCKVSGVPCTYRLLKEGVPTHIVETKLFEGDEEIETARSLVRLGNDSNS